MNNNNDTCTNKPLVQNWFNESSTAAQIKRSLDNFRIPLRKISYKENDVDKVFYNKNFITCFAYTPNPSDLPYYNEAVVSIPHPMEYSICINYSELTFGDIELVKTFGFLLADTYDIVCNELGYKLGASNKVVVINDIIAAQNSVDDLDYEMPCSTPSISTTHPEMIRKGLNEFVATKNDCLVLIRLGCWPIYDFPSIPVSDYHNACYTDSVIQAIQRSGTIELTDMYEYCGSRVFMFATNNRVSADIYAYHMMRYYYKYMDTEELKIRVKDLVDDMFLNYPGSVFEYSKHSNHSQTHMGPNASALIREAGSRNIYFDRFNTIYDIVSVLYGTNNIERHKFAIKIIESIYPNPADREKFKFIYTNLEKLLNEKETTTMNDNEKDTNMSVNESEDVEEVLDEEPDEFNVHDDEDVEEADDEEPDEFSAHESEDEEIEEADDEEPDEFSAHESDGEESTEE